MTNFEPGSYDLFQLLQKLSGSEVPSENFLESIRQWRELTAKKIDLGEIEEDKFIRGVIHEQSAEKLRPFIEIISNSIDACLEFSADKPSLEVQIKIRPDGSYVVEISDKGIGSGMSSDVFVQKYLPPSASTKGQYWSSSIGQMGVGANQQYSLLRQSGDEILVTTTDEGGHATLMAVRPKDSHMMATVASGTVPATHVSSGLDKQGTLTRIALSRETAEAVGFTPNNLIGYIADRFGSYQQANLTIRVVGSEVDISNARSGSHFGLLTPETDYVRALDTTLARVPVEKRQVSAGRSEAIYQVTQEITSKSHFLLESNLAQDYLVHDSTEKHKTAQMYVANITGDVCLVYLSVLGVRFGEPVVIEGHELPTAIDINLDYRVGQISESRSELRLTELDYLRLAGLIGSLEDCQDIPALVRVQIAAALIRFCEGLDTRSPNKLRYDINLGKRLERTLRTVARSVDPQLLWPEQLKDICPNQDSLFLSTKIVGEYVFDFEALGFQQVQMIESDIESDKRKIYGYQFPETLRQPFLWTDQTLIINTRVFPHLLSENEQLSRADILKVLAVQHNLRDAELSSDGKMPMRIEVKVPEQVRAENRGNLREDYDHELGMSRELAVEVKEAVKNISDKLQEAENHWNEWALVQKQQFIVAYINIDHDRPESLDLISELGLRDDEEINAFFTIFTRLVRKNLQDMHQAQHLMQHETRNGAEVETLRTIFNLSFWTVAKQPDVSWQEVHEMYFTFGDDSRLAERSITNTRLFFDLFFSLDKKDIYEVKELQAGKNYEDGQAVGLLAKKIMLKMASTDNRLSGIFEKLPFEVIDNFFLHEGGGVPPLGWKYLFGKIDQMYALFYFYLTEGGGLDPRALKILYSSCKENINKLRAALWIAVEHNLGLDEIKDLMRPDTRIFYTQSEGQKALATFLDENTCLAMNDGLLSKSMSSLEMDRNRSVGEVLNPDASQLALRRVLQNVNSVEPGLGGSVHEAIKNAVQAIARMKETHSEIDGSSRILITDFMEVGTDQNQSKYGFGFRVSDEAGWADAEQALEKLTTPGKGEGLHSVHFLTLLKEYDVVRVRATDTSGKTAFIEYCRSVDRRQQKVIDVQVRHVVVEDECPLGTMVEGVKWTEYPQADSSIFRSSIDHFARNVPQEEAEISFWDGTPEGAKRQLNTSTEVLIKGIKVDGFGQLMAARMAKEAYVPEVSIDHVPIRFDLAGLIKSCEFIPKPFQELLIGAGFTLNLSEPQISIIRSTLEFKDQVVAQQVLKKYLEEQWTILFQELMSGGNIDLSSGGFLAGDAWYDLALFGEQSRLDYDRRNQNSGRKNWFELSDRVSIGVYLYFEPLISISDKMWSLAEIIADQYQPFFDRTLSANDIPSKLLKRIRAGKAGIQKFETATAEDTVEYIDAPDQVRKLLDEVYAVVQPRVENTDDIQLLTHKGSFRGLGNVAFHAGRVVSFNLDTMSSTFEQARSGNLDSIGEVLTTTAHELEHGKRREDESVFSHTQDFYQAVEDTLLSINSEELVPLLRYF